MISENVMCSRRVVPNVRLGQIVPSVKEIVSSIAIAGAGYDLDVFEIKSLADYKKAYRLRIRAAREAMNLDRKEMAERLRMGLDAYRKCENRSGLPLHLVPRFCELTGHGPWYILTGQPEVYSPYFAHQATAQLGQPPMMASLLREPEQELHTSGTRRGVPKGRDKSQGG